MPSRCTVDAKRNRQRIRRPAPAFRELRPKAGVPDSVHPGADFGQVIVHQLRDLPWREKDDTSGGKRGCRRRRVATL